MFENSELASRRESRLKETVKFRKRQNNLVFSESGRVRIFREFKFWKGKSVFPHL
jgi:hypothetical protein